MEFVEMRDKLIEHFNEMVKNINHLFIVDIDKDVMWNTYLNSFPAGTNPIFRERTWHDCSCCRGFIKNIGNVVSIKNGKISTIWDFECDDTTYGPVIKAMRDLIKGQKVVDVFLSTEKKIGCHHNFEQMEKVGAHRWDHFYLELPDKFVARDSAAKNELVGRHHDSQGVLLRSLREISLDAVDTVLDLCHTNTLYKGQEYEYMVEAFRNLKVAFDKLKSEEDEVIFAWEKSLEVGDVVSRIKNHAIGTLLKDVTAGEVDLDEAVKRYEAITAPSNYKRSKPIFTKKMLEDAKKTIEEMGYTNSLPRRHANLDDITVNDILFVNKDDAKRVEGADIFADLAKMTKDSGSPKKFSKVEEISPETFVNEVLPSATNIEVYLENKIASNFVSLIAPQNADSKSMFNWGNNFSWAYAGNLTDSMKERVKAAGGRVDGDLRFSIQWNEDGTDNCDLDAHCKEADGYEIYFGSAKKPSFSRTKGQLDVDIIHPDGEIAVENITWANRKTMKDGVYKFFVNQYSLNCVRKGFRAEIEFDGNIYSFDYPHSMRHDENVQVAEVTLKNGQFSIKCLLDESRSSKTVWNLKTNEFVPVSVVCYSPNHWSTADTQTGHKHLFFMLKNCISEEHPSGMFNEYLVQELYDHRKVMEALGGQMRVESTEDQLSGVGFALDKRAEVVVKVSGSTERVFKIKF